ncbi:hypothetical protein PMAYCL1PPCAC_22301, partial [Pristionchus mayeri]
KCLKLAKSLSNGNFTSSKKQVTCHSYQDTFDHPFFLKNNTTSTNESCEGEFCYMSKFGEDSVTRGCITIVDESLAERKMEAGIYEYMKLNFYLCTEEHCNLRDVDDVKAASPPITTTTKEPVQTTFTTVPPITTS